MGKGKGRDKRRVDSLTGKREDRGVVK